MSSTIAQLNRDNQLLRQELSLESRQTKLTHNAGAMSQIKKLQDQGDAYTRKIEVEKRRISDLDQQCVSLLSPS